MKLKKYLDFFKRKPKSNIPEPMQRLFDCIDRMDLRDSPFGREHTYLSVYYDYNKSNSEEANRMWMTKDFVTLTEDEFIDTLEIGDIKFSNAVLQTNLQVTREEMVINHAVVAISKLLTNWISKSPIRNTQRFIDLLESNGIYYSDIKYQTEPKKGRYGENLMIRGGHHNDVFQMRMVTHTKGMTLIVKNINKEFLKEIVKITYPHSTVTFYDKEIIGSREFMQTGIGNFTVNGESCYTPSSRRA